MSFEINSRTVDARVAVVTLAGEVDLLTAPPATCQSSGFNLSKSTPSANRTSPKPTE